jgi:hypothetical protein
MPQPHTSFNTGSHQPENTAPETRERERYWQRRDKKNTVYAFYE